MTITTQEGVDGYRVTAMRIASVEHVELGSIMELSVTNHVLKWARQSNLSRRVSLSKAHGWNLRNHNHLTVAKYLREKTHSSFFIVTFKESEERGICGATLKEPVKVTDTQIDDEKCGVP